MQNTALRQQRPITHLLLFLTGVGMSMFLGLFCNAINGRICLTYYTAVLRVVRESAEPFRVVLVQGLFEGVCFGIPLALLFVIGLGVINRFRTSYTTGLKFLSMIGGLTILFWGLGGSIALGMAALSTEWYRGTFYVAKEIALSEIPAFAWVGGSIWGLEIGGVVSLIFVLIYAKYIS